MSMPTSQLLPARSREYMPMVWLYTHPGNSACQGLISQGGEFLVLVAQLSFIFALMDSFWPAYYCSNRKHGGSKTRRRARRCKCFLDQLPSLWVFIHLSNSAVNARRPSGSRCEALSSSVGNRRKSVERRRKVVGKNRRCRKVYAQSFLEPFEA
jgi:hypothetical protein